MSIELKPLESAVAANPHDFFGSLGAVGASLDKESLKAEVLKHVESKIGLTIAQASERTLSFTEKRISQFDQALNDAVAEAKKTIAPLMQRQSMVMHVNIKDITRKLTLTAHPKLGEMLKIISSGQNLMLVGPAGCGKTVTGRQIAEALGKPFTCLTCGEGMTEGWVFGRWTPNGLQEMEAMERYEKGGVLMLDEKDNANPQFLVAMNNFIDGDSFFNPITGRTYKKHPDFVLIAGANTAGTGSDGVYQRNRLDGSTLSRFWRFAVDYIDSIEAQLCPDDALRTYLQAARKQARASKAKVIISYRDMKRAATAAQDAELLECFFESITMGWPESLIEQTGMTAKAYKAAQKKAAKAS